MNQIRLKTYASVLAIALPLAVYGQKESPGKKESYQTRMGRFRVKKKDFKKNRYFIAGGSFNFLTYFGDLAPASNFFSTDISQIQPGVSAFIQYRYGPRMSVKGELLYGRLTGDDFTSADPNDPNARSRYIRNLSFRNDILDFSLMSQFYVFKNYLDYRQRKFFNVYLNGGFSVFYHNPKGKVPEFKINDARYPNFGEWVALRPLGTEGQFSEHYDISPYSKVQFSVPVGGGFVFRLNNRLDLIFEINYRLLLTDYIDDVSGNYVDPGALDSDLAKSMSDRSREEYSIMTDEKRDIADLEEESYVSEFDGNRYHILKERGNIRGGAGNDTYLVTSFKISYILGKNRSNDN
ncbi:MAG: hypothetical protein MI975_24405 [Cytophagales bacterium]|nr:hypothetical protein [Cytophagales bacterium]